LNGQREAHSDHHQSGGNRRERASEPAERAAQGGRPEAPRAEHEVAWDRSLRQRGQQRLQPPQIGQLGAALLARGQVLFDVTPLGQAYLPVQIRRQQLANVVQPLLPFL